MESFPSVPFSAGVLLFRHDPDGSVRFLLGQDTREHMLSDFGGKCDPSDHNDPRRTASREFYEETLGVVCAKSTAFHTLESCAVTKSKTFRQNPYYMFVVDARSFTKPDSNLDAIVPDFTLQRRLLLRSNTAHTSPFREKSGIHWVPSHEVFGPSAKSRFRGVFLNTIRTHWDHIARVI